MLDDDSRGYILELMATKLLCLDEQIQLAGMSATLNVRSQILNFNTLLTDDRMPSCWPSG